MRSKIARRILDETPKETRLFVRKQAAITVRINELMKAKGFSQKQLAEEMGKKPSEINRWLKGEHNFTFKSLCHLEAVLGAPIMEIPRTKVFREAGGKKFHVTVYKNRISTSKLNFDPSTGKSFEGKQMVNYGH